MIPNETFIVVIDYTPSTYISKLFGLLLLGQRRKTITITRSRQRLQQHDLQRPFPSAGRQVPDGFVGESYALLSLLG